MKAILILVGLIGFCFEVIPAGPAEDQLPLWAASHRSKHPATGNNYAHVPTLLATLGIGRKGPILLLDLNSQVQLATFTRERIPERLHFAKGTGAKGYFEVTQDMSRYTKAKVFHRTGTKTPVVVRFSKFAGNQGGPSTLGDLRGFAVKFKTVDGNYDLLMQSVPVSISRDPILDPAMTRSFQRNPVTNLKDYDAEYDFVSLRPESTLHVLLKHSDFGFPRNFRHMHGFSVNSFMWVGGTKRTADHTYVRYHLRPNRKIKVAKFTSCVKLAGEDPDYMTRDLYNSIGSKKYPSWTLYVQKFTLSDSKSADFDLFDPTKILFEKEFPLIEVGRLVLNQNPGDFFNDVEQAAFNPGNLVPGIQLSPDRLLQGRPFAYLHAQFHRLGSNFFQLPINGPAPGVKGHSYLRDGFMNIDGNGDGGPNVFPNSFNGPYVDRKAKLTKTKIKGGLIEAVDTPNSDNFSQVDRYWREIMRPAERKRIVNSIAYTLGQASRRIQERSIKVNWEPANQELAAMLKAALQKNNASRRRFSAKKRTKQLKLHD